MANEDERRLVLEMIASGKINAEQGLQLLQSMQGDDPEEIDQPPDDVMQTTSIGGGDDEAQTELTPVEPVPAGEPTDGEISYQGASSDPGAAAPDFTRLRGFWTIPLWIGVVITVLGAWLMFWAQQSAGVSLWFFCAGVPFGIGILLMVLAWQSRTARWLHLRVQQRAEDWPRNFAISFPLPLRFSSWFMRTFGHRISGLEDASFDEVLSTLEQATSPENPIYVEVEEDNGERVQIYIG